MASTPVTEHKLARLCGLISLHKKMTVPSVYME